MTKVYVGIYDMHYDGQSVEFVTTSLEKAKEVMRAAYPKAQYRGTTGEHIEYHIAEQTSFWINAHEVTQ